MGSAISTPQSLCQSSHTLDLTRSPSLLAIAHGLRPSDPVLSLPTSEAFGRDLPLFSPRPRFFPTRLRFSPLGKAAGLPSPHIQYHLYYTVTMADKITTTGLEDQPRACCRLPQHPKPYLCYRWFRWLGREVSYPRPSYLRPRLPCSLHAKHAYPTYTRGA